VKEGGGAAEERQGGEAPRSSKAVGRT